MGVGDLPGGSTESHALAISADGRTVVGESRSDLGKQSYVWTEADGMNGLSDVPGGVFESFATGVSGDGAVVAGYGSDANNTEAACEGFMWTGPFGMGHIGDLEGGASCSRALAISADGSTLVGRGSSPQEGHQTPFHWTLNAGFISLGHLGGARHVNGEARGVSADGSVVAGVDNGQPFRWTRETGMVSLGSFVGVSTRGGRAEAVSADGAVIVGSSSNNGSMRAFRWTEETGMENLGTLPGTDSSTAFGVSADGSVVVGAAADGRRAFVWDRENGMRDIEAVLSSTLDIDGWELMEARGVSADGSVIAGVGIDSAGNWQGWVAVIPRPAPTEVFDAALYFPARPGDFVLSRDGAGHGAWSTVKGYEVVNGVTTLMTEGSLGSRSYDTNDVEGARIHRAFWSNFEFDEGRAADRTTTFTPPLRRSDSAFAVGDVIRSRSAAAYEYAEGPPEAGDYDVTTIIVGHQTVSVPFGTFEAVQMLELTRAKSVFSGVSVAEREVCVAWRVAGLGLVKSIRRGFTIRDGDFYYLPLEEFELVDTNRTFVPEPGGGALTWAAIATLGVLYRMRLRADV